jgi:predicted DNA-binding transcriptional regulator AlpA
MDLHQDVDYVIVARLNESDCSIRDYFNLPTTVFRKALYLRESSDIDLASYCHSNLDFFYEEYCGCLPAANEAFDKEHLIRMEKVVALTGLTKTMIETRMRVGLFPRSFKIGVNSSVWHVSEIHEWMRSNTKIDPLGKLGIL